MGTLLPTFFFLPELIYAKAKTKTSSARRDFITSSPATPASPTTTTTTKGSTFCRFLDQVTSLIIMVIAKVMGEKSRPYVPSYLCESRRIQHLTFQRRREGPEFQKNNEDKKVSRSFVAGNRFTVRSRTTSRGDAA